MLGAGQREVLGNPQQERMMSSTQPVTGKRKVQDEEEQVWASTQPVARRRVDESASPSTQQSTYKRKRRSVIPARVIDLSD